jgi:pimeloyl-ACP methyl ester carboxylesterase
MNVDRYVEVRGSRVRFRTEGSGLPAVLIPGIGAPLESWEWTIAALRDHYTTYAFDYPGFGFSDPVDSSFTPNGSGRTTLAFMDAVGVQRAIIVGSSLGGGIATMAAGMAPGRCAGLVLVAPAGYGPWVSHIARLVALPRVGEGAAVVVRKYPRIMLQNLFADHRLIPDRLVEIAARDAARRSTIENYLKALRGLVTLRGIRPDVVAEIRAAARRIIAPTLIVWGDRDRVIPADQAPVVAQTISGSRLHMMSGLGHVPFIEAADAFNRTMMAFLSMISLPVPSRVAR